MALAVALLAVCPEARAQSEEGVTSVRLKEGGILLEFRTEADPPRAGLSFKARGVTSVREGRNVTHRVFVDQANGATFGYDLEVAPSSIPDHFLLSIKPLSGEQFSVKAMSVKAVPVTPGSAKSVPTRRWPVAKPPTGAPPPVTQAPKFPPAFLIKDGGAFALDVLVNPQTGVKIVDVVRVSSEGGRAAAGGTSEPAPARSFTPLPLELSVENFRLLINGRPALGAERPVRGGVSGELLWLYLPGRGRFIFSVVPHEGYPFRRAGSVEGDRISFRVAGERYEWISGTPVFAGGREADLWVLHDTRYSPQNDSFPPGGYQIGASSHIEYLIKR